SVNRPWPDAARTPLRRHLLLHHHFRKDPPMKPHDLTPTRAHPRRRRTLTMTGAAIAVVGLALTMVTSASADAGWRSPKDNPPTTAPQRGQDITNVTFIDDKIELYYGSVTKDIPTDTNSNGGVAGTPGEHCPFGIAGPQTCLTSE